MLPLTLNRYFVLQGYLELLTKCIPNGRLNHTIAQKVVVLRLSLRIQRDIDPATEEEIKGLIRGVYGNNQSDSKEDTDIY